VPDLAARQYLMIDQKAGLIIGRTEFGGSLTFS
jgi:hypothetical protein